MLLHAASDQVVGILPTGMVCLASGDETRPLVWLVSDRLKHGRAVGSYATALADRGNLTEWSQRRMENGVGRIEGLAETAQQSRVARGARVDSSGCSTLIMTKHGLDSQTGCWNSFTGGFNGHQW